jgi:hypothetical protein
MAGARPTRGLRRTGGLRQSAPALADPINQEHPEHPEALDPAAKNGALARAAAEVGTWLFPLLVCVVRAGLRIGEVLALRPEDLDLTTAGRETLRVARARTIDRAGRVVLDDPKTEAGRRPLRLSPAVVTVLRRRRDGSAPSGSRMRASPCRHAASIAVKPTNGFSPFSCACCSSCSAACSWRPASPSGCSARRSGSRSYGQDQVSRWLELEGEYDDRASRPPWCHAVST